MDKKKEGRRLSGRKETLAPVKLALRDMANRKPSVLSGDMVEVSADGVSVILTNVLPQIQKGTLEIVLPGRSQSLRIPIEVRWRRDEERRYGLRFVRLSMEYHETWQAYLTAQGDLRITDRRTNHDRRGEQAVSLPRAEARRTIRRFNDFSTASAGKPRKTGSSIRRADLIPNCRDNDYTVEAARARRTWLRERLGVSLDHMGAFRCDPDRMRGNIENLIGTAEIPIGIAGPLLIRGDNADGLFYVPMATTEGVLVVSYTLGMTLLTQAGGVRAKILSDQMHVSPVFGFDDIDTAYRFVEWLTANFAIIKREADSTTKHGKLLHIEPHILNKHVAVKFCYDTGDAMGMNMINFATDKACRLIVSTVRPSKFYIRSNFSSDKKVTSHNFVMGKGKTVVVDATIDRAHVERFNTTPEDMEAYYQTVMLTSSHAGMLGMNGQVANTIAALYLAFGQDVASVANSFIGNTTFEVTARGDLYVSLHLPSLILGTVGGGTGLPTQRECLQIVGCDGPGTSRKLAEIVAATALAGELAICLSINNRTFVQSHSMFGRKPPSRL